MRKLFKLALAAAFVLASQSEALAFAVPAMRPMPYAPPPRLALSAFPPRQLPAVQLTGNETSHQARLSPMWVHAARLAMAAALRAVWVGPAVRVRRGNVTNLAFNSVNQLTQVDLPDGTRSSYKYDAAGRRVEKSTGSTSNPAVTRFIYDGQNILAALDGNNNLLALFTQGPGIDQPLIMRKPDGTKFFMLADALGSVVAHADESGAVAERVAYEAYGKPVFVDVRGPPAVAAVSLTGAPFAFTGRTWENETGLFDYRYRQVHDPRIGRFGQEDPIGLAGGHTNLYTYTSNRPTNYRDPMGLMDQPGYDASLDAWLLWNYPDLWWLAQAYGGIIAGGTGLVIISFPHWPAGALAIVESILDRLLGGDKFTGDIESLKDWIGPDPTITPQPNGNIAIVSKDKKRVILGHVKDPSPHENPHMHVRWQDPSGKWHNERVYPRDVECK
jgi:RHS repeat-associated protein